MTVGNQECSSFFYLETKKWYTWLNEIEFFNGIETQQNLWPET